MKDITSKISKSGVNGRDRKPTAFNIGCNTGC